MPRSSRIFRLFVSSTFTDLKHERMALQRHVFPRLKELCEQYGTKFQAIDLRWGVSTEAQLDHRTLDICINELRRCKELSPKPNFLIMLGNRYGWRPIPNMIEKSEFEMILSYIKVANTASFKYLQEWFQEDRNQLPASYRLKPRTGKYVDPEQWQQVENQLRFIFDEVVEVLPFSPEQRNKYILSATEHEIREGAFAQKDAEDHVFAVFREINGIPTSPKAKDYLDYTFEGIVDKDNQQRLDKLKQDIESLLPESNICHHSINWNEEDFDLSYLPDFCEEILVKLEAVIKRECEEIMEFTFVEKEQSIHQQFYLNHSKHFIGRENQINLVKSKLESSYHHLVISGESGSGKTAFAAALSHRLQQEIPTAKVIQRFIGASSFGMNTFELMQSILAELNPRRAEDILEKRQITELVIEMKDIFQLASKKRPFIIIIDAIDQLRDQRILTSLFSQELPKHVTIIATIANDSSMYPLLKGMLLDHPFIEITEMSREDARELLHHWLQRENRTLQPKQEEVVLQAFQNCPLPLYLKLAMEEIKLWTSYMENYTLLPSIDGVLEQFFQRLSHPANHGPVLIKNVFGLLSAARNGLEETELLDLLSNNSEVKNDFYKQAKHEYVNETLPIVIWARLFNELEPYLMERNENGSYLYSFYHRQIGNKIKNTYLAERFHKDIVDYFEGKLNFVDVDASRIPNTRKSIELPYQLYKAGLIQQLEILLTEFQFLQSKLQSRLSHDLLKDFENLKYLQLDLKLSTTYTDDFARFCRIRHALLLQYPEQILPIALQMPKTSTVFQEAKRWYEERSIPYLVSARGQSVQEDRNLHTFQLTEGNPSFCLWNPDGTHLLTVYDEVIRFWDTLTGEETEQLQPGIGRLINAAYTEQQDKLVISSEHKLKILQLPAYSTICEIETKETITKIVWSPNAESLAIGTERGFVELFTLKTMEKEVFRPLQTAILQMSFRLDGEELAICYKSDLKSSIYEKIVIWDLNQQISKKTLRSKFQFKSGDSRYYEMHYDSGGRYLSTNEEDQITIWDTDLGVKEDSTVNLNKGRHFFYPPYVISVLDTMEIHVWEKEAGNGLLYLKQPPSDTLKAVDFRDGRLATITVEGEVTIWDFQHIDANNPNKGEVEWAYHHPLWVFSNPLKWFRMDYFSSGFIKPKKNLTKKIEQVFDKSSYGTDDRFSSMVVNSALSPSKEYFASIHLGQYLQIQDQSQEEIIQYMPHKQGNLQFCHWSHDEMFIVYGTKKFAWIMAISSGYVKKMLETNCQFVTVLWSPVQHVVCVIHSNGLIELMNVDSNQGKAWRIDKTDLQECRILAKWSPDGKFMAIFMGKEFYVYKVSVSKGTIQEGLVRKGTLTQQAENFEWSPDNNRLAVLNEKFEIMIIELDSKKVINQLTCFSTKPTGSLSFYLQDILLEPSEKMFRMEEMVGLERKNQSILRIEKLTQILGATALLTWNESGNELAVGLGQWLKVFRIAEEKETDLLFTDEPIIHMSWLGEDLYTVEGNQMSRKVYEWA